ncbi:hypothetical protein PGT21_012875 [Puccinia graminis f. sp. tritici]|uniref:Uncharacterized protein n=1 Tax=Puccinia graminis f. sp. tritici TaxID=56615 RepID=A0A5B0Q5T9_PUCGR|nr:hypothetical protein PGT21_012875 [Puccinia graminis f. sp. tritici]
MSLQYSSQAAAANKNWVDTNIAILRRLNCSPTPVTGPWSPSDLLEILLGDDEELLTHPLIRWRDASASVAGAMKVETNRNTV